MHPDAPTDAYFSVDVETDGPIPGPYSMLSFALVEAGRGHAGAVQPPDAPQSFYVELRPIGDAVDPEALAVSGLDRDRLIREGAAPEDAMARAAQWIAERAGGATPVLVGYPLGFDWMWLTWYFVRFAGASPFRHSGGFDVKTAFAVKAGRPIAASGRSQLPPALQSATPHTHHALDDARGQADVFARLSAWRGPAPLPPGRAPGPPGDGGVFERRRAATEARLATVRETLARLLEPPRCARAAENTVIFTTGSAGRGELTASSDLDVFLVRRAVSPDADPAHGGKAREAHQLDQMVLQGVIVQAFDQLDLEPPSNGGEFLELHTAAQLCRQIGDRHDDPTNTFTARMLLLLESQPLVGDRDALVRDVLAVYWENWERFLAENRAAGYVPLLLVNDVVRYWRALLLGYVAKNIRKGVKDTMDAEKGLRSYKLRFARCLTCYSLLLELVGMERRGELLSPEAVKAAVDRRPVERLQHLRDAHPEHRAALQALLDQYDRFLEVVGRPRDALLQEFGDKKVCGVRVNREGGRFGDAVATLLATLGGHGSRVFRHTLV